MKFEFSVTCRAEALAEAGYWISNFDCSQARLESSLFPSKTNCNSPAPAQNLRKILHEDIPVMTVASQKIKRLFAVYLGGRAPRCNTELHDVVFVAGDSVESCYERLMDKWFGNPLRVHIDSWLDLQVVDGHRISLRPDPPHQDKKLFFINLGAYLPGQFTELHANAFIVATSEADVKTRAKTELLCGTQAVHTDDLYEIDDCLEINEVDGQHLHLEATAEKIPLDPQNGYHVIPPEIVAAYAARLKQPKKAY